jgi:hypothetical protein
MSRQNKPSKAIVPNSFSKSSLIDALGPLSGNAVKEGKKIGVATGNFLTKLGHLDCKDRNRPDVVQSKMGRVDSGVLALNMATTSCGEGVKSNIAKQVRLQAAREAAAIKAGAKYPALPPPGQRITVIP